MLYLGLTLPFQLCPKGRYAKGKFTERFLKCANECNYKLDELPDLYNTLSEEIHGQPWYGPTVVAHFEAIDDEAERCFIKGFVTDMGIDISSFVSK